MVSYELSPKYLLGISTLENIRPIDTYIFCGSFCRSVRTSFWLFCIPLNCLLIFYRVQTIRNPGIFRSTSEERIWIFVVTFSMFIFRVAWIERWIEFLIASSLNCFLKKLISWVYSSTVNAPSVINVCSFCIFYCNIQV